jgi:dolichol-phosphate mannosyltransferase
VHVVALTPTYNEVENLEAVVKGIRAVVPDAGILVIDDGSTDGTAALARRLGEELGAIELLSRPAKRGLGSAYRDGFRRAIDSGAEICVQIDADLSHDPQVLPALVANVEH